MHFPAADEPIVELGKGRFLQLLSRGGWEFADRIRGTGVVAIVAVTDKDELVLTRQFRPAIGKQVIDLPAGLVGDTPGSESEPFEAAARRELLEETGYEAGILETVFTGPSSAGLSTEMITFFRADQVRKVGAGGGDESESITVLVVPRAELRDWLRGHENPSECIDPKVYAALGILGS
ncbi:NUDIX hydrolase [Planctomicrobium sp. SH664]|uniref:NUDIX hydrolase n=1 Tax=Planctomicrobium sp. SH664 TaxID=3448125 RepID=UPI003F5B3325